MREEGLVVFNGTHISIKAENICKEKGLEVELVSTHPKISKGCGFMLKIEWEKFTELVKILETEKIEYKALYYSKREGLKREIEMLYEN